MPLAQMHSKTVFSERGDWKAYTGKGDSEDIDVRVTGDDVPGKGPLWGK